MCVCVCRSCVCRHSCSITLNSREMKINTFVFQKGIIAHEFAHALGLIHEQSRPDRDTFVEIFRSNIMPDKLDNFLLVPFSLYLSQYDYGSMMQYEPNVSW